MTRPYPSAFSRTPHHLLLATLAGLTAACVAKPQYDESQAWALDYQQQALEAQDRVVQLEGEVAALEAQLRDHRLGTANAGFSDENLEGRLADLRSRIAGLGRPPGDIERFDVEGGYVYMIQDKVLFDLGSYEIGADGRAALLELARNIQDTPHGRVIVRGHTDNVPVVKPETKARLPHGNLQLSAMRAVSVGALLIEQGGLPGKDVVVAGYGEWEPVQPNTDADKRRLNRRVEIFVEDPSR